ncbi:carbon-nitrogen hydrolase family protein [Paractinoplanes hotanensis]|uniref:Carbon-nitrogen hydrolase family protein n=1 Tax=Paractinoplanes hotanensis TaxID=2906497 RepID=A0ABT0YF38_9ACTN|nr:carbon-nitrogen hydrolase family protein [Actinoplanes hotanensis]MCM4084137.1 carbon-nitrogen hydrolase family protein [Actinoplanes hotanensis]
MNVSETAVTRIACWQPEWVAGRSQRDEFLDRLATAASTAADGGATLLVTPEMSATGYHLGKARTDEVAEPPDGPLADGVRAVARRAGLAIVYGWPERDGDTVYNSVQLVDAGGAVAARYRKTHLYSDIDRSVYAPGDRLVVQAALGPLTVGLVICYDVEFPETVRAHALAGTQLLVAPTALVRPWQFVARTIVPARAFESQLFVAYVNWHSAEPEGYCGLSAVHGPDGRPRAEAGEGERLVLADVDPAALAAARRATPYLTDRRPELYGST